MSLAIPTHLLSFCHVTDWVAGCYVCGISCTIQSLVVILSYINGLYSLAIFILEKNETKKFPRSRHRQKKDHWG